MRIADRLTPLVTALCLSVLLAAQASGSEAVIRLVGYSESKAQSLGLETQRAMPLDVIGVGQPVYLKSEHEGTYSWSVVVPEGSSTALSSTTDREVYLVPDMVGSYVVTLSYTDPEGAASTAEMTITGATFAGVGTVGGATPGFPQCGLCHQEKTEGWSMTGHATITERDIDGLTSSHIGGSCLPCHSTGFDSLAVNGGFDDLAGEEGWTFPETPQEGNSEILHSSYPLTSRLANVQCEACHGPGSEHRGSGPIATSYDGGVCGYCHDAPTHHTQATEWMESAHGQTLPSEEHYNQAGTACVPCHTAQGFFEVNVSQTHKSTAPYDIIQGATCVVCHDPHDASGTFQLRAVEDYNSVDSTGMAAYKTDGTAEHACDVCHHLRPGTFVPGSRPHESHQTDVLSGNAGYRYPGREYPANNAHNKIIEGRCTGCHMYGMKEGQEVEYEKGLHVGSHTFAMHAEADPENGGPEEDYYLTEACSGCHNIGEDLDYRGVQTLVTELLDRIKAELPVYGEEAASYLQGNPRYSQMDMDAGVITEAQMNAAYNWYIFSQDGSRGIHNPALAISILSDALEDLGGALPTLACDFNEDGKINIADVISLLLFQRANPGDLKGDYNGDGKANISDAIAMLIQIMNQTCPGSSVLLASAGQDGYLEVSRIADLTREEIDYVEQMMSRMDLTEEQEAAFRVALYGKAAAASLPKAFALGQNSPNPFNPATTISYSVPEGQSAVRVRLEVFDIRGRLVQVLVDEAREAGTYHVLWDGTDSGGRHLASGVYLYRIHSGEFVKTRKMVLLK
ncbi:MAG: T9SS type A sorting domain-containing protein [Candidatus Glassbacteria bacterium]|nr:T9SS type A sorting domain-containing protein [Candidatus Glassbacteria bacterium]